MMKKKAVFLDRDGVINKEKGGWIYRISDFEFNENIFEALKILRKKKYIFIVVTNQSGIAKKVYSHAEVKKLHRYMIEKFKRNGIKIADVYYCPHHDEDGKCLCRKPNALMLEKAIAKYNIDVSKSFLIGDKERDIKAAERAGVKGFLVKPNELKIALILCPRMAN